MEKLGGSLIVRFNYLGAFESSRRNTSSSRYPIPRVGPSRLLRKRIYVGFRGIAEKKKEEEGRKRVEKPRESGKIKNIVGCNT